MICQTTRILLSYAEMRLSVKCKDLTMRLIPGIYASAAGQDLLKNRGQGTIVYALVVLKSLIIDARKHGDTKKIVFGNQMIF
jgi:hypothetical protein